MRTFMGRETGLTTSAMLMGVLLLPARPALCVSRVDVGVSLVCALMAPLSVAYHRLVMCGCALVWGGGLANTLKLRNLTTAGVAAG